MQNLDTEHKNIRKNIHSVKDYLIHGGLFVVTIVTTTLAGQFFMQSDHFLDGLHYSLPLLGILTVHEFGHYIAARLYKIKVTLPYYIPMWFGGGMTIGTMGAVIRIKEQIRSRRAFFDIGIAGPLAGFVAALIVLGYGFMHLPPPEHIFTIHPEYAQFGLNYADHVYADTENIFYLGKNLLYMFFERFAAGDAAAVPNSYEIIHYPYLFAGYLALFFTALNLMPVGQLDGGHIVFGIFGKKFGDLISKVVFFAFVFYAGLGLVTPQMPIDELMWGVPLYIGFLYIVFSRMIESKRDRFFFAVALFLIQYFLALFFRGIEGYSGWLLFALLIGRFIGVKHPMAVDNAPLSTFRLVLGWATLIIFVLCFIPQPFIVR